MKKVLIIFIGLLLLIGCSQRDWELEANNNLKDNEQELMKIVMDVKNNKLEQRSDTALYILPKDMKYLSQTGVVYVYQNDKDGLQVGFYSFRGMQSGSCYLMYSSGGEKMIKKNETGHPIIQIKHIKDNWYYVETDY